MLKEEAAWIKGMIDKFVIKQGLDVLDVGSSTLKFRTLIQPYIDEYVFAPLREKNNNIFYLDKKKDEGIDYAFDINDMSADSIDKKFDVVFCCNLLEHVNDRNKIYGLLSDFLKNNGLLILTVPEAYRFHPDPIDTMFRPRMRELINLFSKFGNFEIIETQVVVINDKKRYSKGIGEKLRYNLPFLRWRINCLLLRKK
ncbi:MAG: methyltransferase domain-containing protein [Candidatus Omnitrophota bacterium]